MLEAILAVGIAASLIGISTAIISSQSQKQQSSLLGAEKEAILTASRSFISQNYATLQEDLFEASKIGGQAIRIYTTDDLVARGYLTPSFLGSGILNRLHGQRYSLLMRAVNRSDVAVPQTTLTQVQIDPMANDVINPALVDQDPTNGEMDIEAILVTSGGTPIRAGTAGDIMSGITNAYTGYVYANGVSSGPYGSFSLNITPYSGLADYPTAGRFASVIALSTYGVLGDDGLSENGAPLDPLRRCVDLDVSSALYADCLSDNNVYTDIVFNPYDSDANGSIDVFPAIRGISMVQCANNAGVTGSAGSFLIDCAETAVSGNFTVDGPNVTLGNMEITADRVAFDGEDILERRDVGGVEKNITTTDRTIIGDLNGGQDISEAIIDSRVVLANSLVDKPVCPARTLDGANTMTPRIYVTPAAYSDPQGRPVVGVRAFTEDVSPTQWRVRLLAFVGQDLCGAGGTNGIPNAILPGYSLATNGVVGSPVNNTPGATAPVRCSTFNPDGTVLVFNGDGNSDIYQLGPNSGAVLAQTRCY